MGLLEALPEDLTHHVLGFLQLKRNNPQPFLDIVEGSKRAADDLRRSIPEDEWERDEFVHGNTFRHGIMALSRDLRDELHTFTKHIKASGALLFVCKNFRRLFWKKARRALLQSDPTLFKQCSPAADSLIETICEISELGGWDPMEEFPSNRPLKIMHDACDAAFTVMCAVDAFPAEANADANISRRRDMLYWEWRITYPGLSEGSSDDSDDDAEHNGDFPEWQDFG